MRDSWLQCAAIRLADGPPRWLPALATSASAAAGGAIGRSGVWQVDAVLAAFLIAAALLSPPLGLAALVSAALCSPLAIVNATHTPANVTLIAVPALAALWLGRALHRRDTAVLRLPAVRAACALVAAAVLAGAVGNLPWLGFGHTAPATAQVGGIAVFALSAAVLVLAADQLRDPRALQRVTWVFLAAAAVMIAGYVVPEIEAPAWWLVQPDANGSMTWTWFAALATAHAAYNRTLHWRVRLLLGVGVATLFFFGLGDGRDWVSGWLPPLVAALAVICVARPRLGAALLIAGGAAVLLRLPQVVEILMAGDNRYSLTSRLSAWRILAQISAANPLLGLGPANYYHVTPLFDIRGYHVNFSSHSTYVDLVAQTGMLGLGCFAWLCWAVAREGWRLRGSDLTAGFPRAYTYAALGGLAGTLAAAALGDWVLPFVYNVTLEGLRASLMAWLFLGGLLALGRGVRTPAPTRAHAWSTRRVLLLIIALDVLLRLAAAVWLGDSAEPLSGAYDQLSYDTLAQRVLGGHGFTFPTGWYPFTEANEPTAHWSYLYTLYLAAVYGLFGHHPLAARLLQALASGIGCWLIFRIGRRLFDERVGLAAAALTAAYAYFVFFNAALMTQTFFILALLVAVDRALAIAARPTTGAWVQLGLALGAGALLRQTLLLFTPLLLLWILWSARGRTRWSGPLVAVAMIAVCVAPWTLRNQRVFGDFLLLNSNGGYFFYAANHPAQGTHFDPTYVAPLPDELRGQSEPAIDRALFRAAMGFIAAEPLRFLRLSWNRLGDYYWLLPSPQSSPASNGIRLCSFTLYAPLMLYGLVRSRRRWRACLPLYLYVAFDTGLHLTSWAAPRYRLPSDALLMVFAGLAVVDIGTRLGLWVPAAPSRSGGSTHDRMLPVPPAL